MRRDFPLPSATSARTRRPSGASCRVASSVLLLRSAAPTGVEVFTFRRVPTLAFAPGMLVFPGGAVDPGDADPALGWVGTSAADLARDLDTDPVTARSVVAAAVRETFEECGVLLAGSVEGLGLPPATVVLDDPAWEARRQALLAGKTTLGPLLGAVGLALRPALLHPWARWVTPESEARRFDAWFFVAELPAGQEPRDLGGEAEAAGWLRPGEAIEQYRAGRLPMLPPTVVLLEELAVAASVAAVLSTPRRVRPVQPQLIMDGVDGEGSPAPVLRVDTDGRGGAGPEPRWTPPEPPGPPWSGGDVGAYARCLLAPNPGPLTLDGTNTWLLAAPGGTQALVVDPGPDDDRHLRAVLAAAAERGLRVTRIVLTHGHPDHSAGAPRLSVLAGGIPIAALDPEHTIGGENLIPGEVITVDGLEVEVVPTPGHSGDSVCFLLPGSGIVLTGDTILGRGTTMVAHPDGRLDDYLASLRRLGSWAHDGRIRQILPGHGPALQAPEASPSAVVEYYLRHRQERLEQVRAAVVAGARTAAQVVEQVYAAVPQRLWPAAERSVRAQLSYLEVGQDGAPGARPPLSASALAQPIDVQQHHGAGL